MKTDVRVCQSKEAVGRKRPKRVSELLLCESVVEPIERHLQATGRDRCEEAALLAGYYVGGSVALATTALLTYTDHSAGSCEIPLDVMFKCSKLVRRNGMWLLAQIHSHPSRCSDHSSTDDHWAVCDSPGFFSIVVPCFARFGLGTALQRGVSVNERMSDGTWRVLPAAEVEKRIIMIPSTHVVV